MKNLLFPQIYYKDDSGNVSYNFEYENLRADIIVRNSRKL